MKGILVVVPCGQGKIWDKSPNLGPMLARETYTGAPFKVNREYAERFGQRWVILSAKYGFICPDFLIPGPYNVTFKKKSTNPVTIATLREQVRAMALDSFETVVALGGKEYRVIVGAAFAGTPARVLSPFAGLPIGKGMQAIKRAIEMNQLCLY